MEASVVPSQAMWFSEPSHPYREILVYMHSKLFNKINSNRYRKITPQSLLLYMYPLNFKRIIIINKEA